MYHYNYYSSFYSKLYRSKEKKIDTPSEGRNLSGISGLAGWESIPGNSVLYWPRAVPATLAGEEMRTQLSPRCSWNLGVHTVFVYQSQGGSRDSQGGKACIQDDLKPSNSSQVGRLEGDQ